MNHLRSNLGVTLVGIALVVGACGTGGSSQQLVHVPPLASGPVGVSGRAAVGGAMAYPVPVNVQYQIQGTLPTVANHAEAYRLTATTTPARVGRLASAFGLTGAVQAGAAGWTVTDGTHAVQVQRSGGLPWTFSSTAGGGVVSSGCAVASPGSTTGPVSGGGGGSGGAAPSAASPIATMPVAPPLTCPPPTTVPGLPSQTQAEQTARDALTRAGFDLSGSTLVSSGGSSEWTVSVMVPMGGAPLMRNPSSLAVGAHGAIEFASGYLADAVAAGDYPLVDVAAGVQRLRDGGRWILRAGPGPEPMMGAAAVGSAGGVAGGAPSGGPTVTAVSPPSTMVCPPGAMCATPSPGPTPCPPGTACTTPPEPPVTIRIVTGAHLGLAWAWPADPTMSDAWLLPVFVFELDGGMTVPVLALPDGYLSAPSATTLPSVATIPTPAPKPQPGTQPAPSSS
jgi:hypothetical protein